MSVTLTLAPAISSALDDVRIHAGGRTGAAGDHQIKAASRREFRMRLANAIYFICHLGAAAVIEDHAESRRDLASRKS
jgi:hypothetical protein